jgi:hypothetical protein
VFPSCWYGSRKVLLSKEILILLGNSGRGTERGEVRWRTLTVMLVAVERQPTRAHGGSDGGSGWEAR